MKRLFEIYDVFTKRLSGIRKYIDQTMMQHELINSIEKRICNVKENELSYFQYLKSLKSSTIQYNALIISIYGCFENYVDSLSSQYCSMVFQESTCYGNLPLSLKEKLRNKIGEYLSNPQRFPEDIDVNKTVEQYSMMLRSDLSNPVDLRFAITHGGNLRSAEVAKLFQDITEIKTIEHILHSQSIKSFYINNQIMDEEEYSQKLSRACQNFKGSEIMKPLEELVTQRNSVAHSWQEDSRISIDYITNYIIPFLRALSYSLMEICIISYFQLFPNTSKAFPAGAPIAVYNHNIVCINNQSIAIGVGDCIVYGNEQYTRCAIILNIQHNGVDIPNVDSSQSIDIGIKIDGKFANCDFIKYIINL